MSSEETVSVTECLSRSAVQVQSSHPRANKCTGAAVNAKEKDKWMLQREQATLLFILQGCKAARLRLVTGVPLGPEFNPSDRSPARGSWACSLRPALLKQPEKQLVILEASVGLQLPSPLLKLRAASHIKRNQSVTSWNVLRSFPSTR